MIRLRHSRCGPYLRRPNGSFIVPVFEIRSPWHTVAKILKDKLVLSFQFFELVVNI